MTNKCVVCSRRGKPGDCLSFHRFPVDAERKQMWLSALNLENVGKWHYVCSNHFHENDYILKRSGLRVLKATAIPALPDAVITTDRTTNAKSLTKSACRELFALPEIKIIPGYSEHHNEPSTSKESQSLLLISNSGHDSSSTITASEKTLSPSDRTVTASEGTLTASDSSTLTGSECMESLELISDLPSTVVKTSGVENTEIVRKKRRLATSSSSSLSTVAASEGFMDETKPVQKTPVTRGSQKKRLKSSRKKYVGDITSGDLATPTKAKRSFNLAKSKLTEYRKKIAVLQKKNRRAQSRVTCLKSLLTFLKKKHLLSENAQDSIEASLPGPAGEIVKRILKRSKGAQYSPSLRAFALTLHFYSPRAYNYVRDKFNRSLPHPSTVSKWYQKIDGSPGFTEEALNALRSKVMENKNKGKETYGNLVMDEMSIRKKVEWVGQKCVGYVDIGANLEGESLPQAKEVLVFLVTSVNGSWKIPVGYFCIDGLSGSERANLVNHCLEFLNQSGVIITSLTFDGAASNLNMASKLGANFSDPQNLKSYFEHPITKDKIFIFLDICHMIKLVRNCLGDLKTLSTADGKVVNWCYLNELVNFQCNEGLNAACKLKSRHMQYAREKMRVRIATQTFSKSVSDALRFLEQDLRINVFQGAEETANFCLLFNDVFDILNSRSKFCTYLYKKALCPDTEQKFFKRFTELKEYILGLRLKDVPVTSSLRKTGFLGFLIGMESFTAIYKKYVHFDAKLDFLLGYKFSQDHLETMFSAVRSMGGFNNNPTCRQFQSAYKKILVSKEIRGADTGNAVTLDNTLILNVSSRKITLNDDKDDLESSEDYKKLCDDLDDHDYFSSTGWQLSSFVNDVIIYIAGFVVKSLKKCVTCSKCLSLLETNETTSFLQKRKTFGNLIKASSFVTDICTSAEKVFRQLENKNLLSPKYNNILNLIIHKTVHSLPKKVFEKVGDHILDGELLDNHQLSLIKLVLKRYFTIRIHHETRKKSDEVKNRVRSILTHLILYQNQ